MPNCAVPWSPCEAPGVVAFISDMHVFAIEQGNVARREAPLSGRLNRLIRLSHHVHGRFHESQSLNGGRVVQRSLRVNH